MVVCLNVRVRGRGRIVVIFGNVRRYCVRSVWYCVMYCVVVLCAVIACVVCGIV